MPTPPAPFNEPVRSYQSGSAERQALQQRLTELSAEVIEVPLQIGDRLLTTGILEPIVMPHNFNHQLGEVHQGGAAEMEKAIQAAQATAPEWSRMPWTERAAIFLRAAELLAGPMRDTINGATMLGQSKTVQQAEIDAACELCDFLRFNVSYLAKIYAEQPISPPGVWNSMEYRPLEGFTLAITPFNFTSIAANLPAAPALMGNTVIWKPSQYAVFSAHYLTKLFAAAGLPPGVINVVYGPPAELVQRAIADPNLAGIHYTGSTTVFQQIWQAVGQNISTYRNYPRLVGETGGKDFILAHSSADLPALTTAIIRGGFEYQGQKCSAVSRVFIPQSLWLQLQDQLIEEVKSIKMGDVADFSNFMGAVIHQQAFHRLRQAIEFAKTQPEHQLLVGGGYHDQVGWFIEPTVVVTENPNSRLLREELFGPLVTIFLYPDQEYEKTLELIDSSTPYGLTGAIFANDRRAVALARDRLRYTAGNFYINDKPTGAVVGQQPFGGSRASGTNDKAGSLWNLIRWVSPRTIKESWALPTEYRYPHQG